jgi:hypothetical protein
MNPLFQNISFEQAITETQSFLQQQSSNLIDNQDFAAKVSLLLQSENGARGFFVGFLTGDWEMADQKNPDLIEALNAHPQSDLLIKNLVMSTAMAVIHRRNHNHKQAEGSDRVARRTALLISQLIGQFSKLEIQTIAQQMSDSANGNSEIYSQFLAKWGYDAEQKLAIANCLIPYLSSVLP